VIYFLLGFFIGGFIFGGAMGHTRDTKIVSGRPFDVDGDSYQCTFVGKTKDLK
jgi:hypothetical protein